MADVKQVEDAVAKGEAAVKAAGQTVAADVQTAVASEGKAVAWVKAHKVEVIVAAIVVGVFILVKVFA